MSEVPLYTRVYSVHAERGRPLVCTPVGNSSHLSVHRGTSPLRASGRFRDWNHVRHGLR